MPLFAAAFLGALVSAAGTIVGRVLIALSIGYVTYSGLSAGVGWVKDQVMAELGGLSAGVLQVVGTLQVDTAVSILASAVIARWTLRGLTGGALTRMVVK
jgi:uncharacterized protein DUF2523